MVSRCLLVSLFILYGVLSTHQAVIGVARSVSDDVNTLSQAEGAKNLDTEDYEVLEADEVPPSDEGGPTLVEPRSQLGSSMASGMQTGGTSVDKFGSGLASWGNSVANFGQGWTNMGQSLQTVDEKLG